MFQVQWWRYVTPYPTLIVKLHVHIHKNVKQVCKSMTLLNLQI